MRGSRGREALVALLGYLALTLVLCWRLLPLLDRAYFDGGHVDTLEILWYLDWMKTAVFDLKTNPLYTPNVFHPSGMWIAGTAQPGWLYIMLSPLVVVLEPLLVYNLAGIIALPFAGLGVWWLVRDLTGNRWAAFIAGTIYMLAPILTLRLFVGHFQSLMAFICAPWAAMCFYQAMRKPEDKSPVYIALAGLLLALTSLLSWYFLFIATLPLAGVLFAVSSPIPLRRRLFRAVIIGLIMLIAIVPSAILSIEGRRQMIPSGSAFTVYSAIYHSVSPDYLVAPNLLNPLAEHWRSIWPTSNHEVFTTSLGYGAMALAAVGLVALPWRRTRPFVAVGLIALVLALGPLLKWQDQIMTVAPPAVAERLLGDVLTRAAGEDGRFPIPLPGLLLYRFLPFYDAMRVMARFMAMAIWAEAVLAGLGAAVLMARGRGSRLLAAGLFALVLLEFALPIGRSITYLETKTRDVDVWLADQSPQMTVIEYPFGMSQVVTYRQSLHDHRIVNGYASFPPELISDATDELGRWPQPEALPVLRAWGVDTVLVNRVGYDAAFRRIILPQVEAIDGLCYVDRFGQAALGRGQTYVYRVVPEGEGC